MARHTRRLPRDREERDRATQLEAGLLEQLGRQANEVCELEAAAREAKEKLHDQILRHVEARDLDISDMAKATGISRQTIHRLVRSRNPAPPRPAPGWVTGQRVVHRSRGAGTIERADGPSVSIRFDSGERHELHAALAGIKPL
jgi:DNA-binding phage protein